SYAGHIPAISHEASCNILAKGQGRVAFDGDAVVVVDPAKITELEMSGKRCRFAGDAFHHASITAQSVDVVIEHLKVRPVEVRSHPFTGNRHANTRSDAVSQWSGGGLNARGPVIFGMARAFAIELAKMLDVLKRN